ncbi:MAG: hypothetical protein GC151_14670 [Betaproteobacteria bacterium]|nr:hypothetical protein [Betaproteobacteria bacterium]
MSALRTIVYASTAAYLMTLADLEALLTDARELNERHGITGVLLYSDGTFMQCFEGEEPAMEETYGRIIASRKHHSIIEMLNEPIERRSFPDWHMGFFGPPEARSLFQDERQWRRLGAPGGVAWESLAYNFVKHFRVSLKV